MSLLGIDIGTTGCKAAAFAVDGACYGIAYREYATAHAAPGRAELDSREVWRCARAVIADAASRTGSDLVTALSVSSMGEAATPVNNAREILGPCILGSDDRGAEYIDRLRSDLGERDFYAINPNILAASYTLPKLQWRRDNESELYAQADRFMLFDGLIGFMLGCEPFVSWSGANRTLLFDIHAQDWSARLLAKAGIDADKLPRCLPAGAVAGTVDDRAAEELGLPGGIAVVVGGHDQCCNALGAGIVNHGQAVDGIGTFECIAPVYESLPDFGAMRAAGLNIEHHVVDGRYTSFLYNQAGSIIRWFRDTFAGAERDDPAIYDKLGDEVPAHPTDLFVLPYFEPSGSPDFVSDATGAIVGLTPATTRGEIYRACMESITYYFVEHLATLAGLGVDTSEFVATGGGARSDQWLQIKADILGVPYVRLKTTECGLVGAAILAGVGSGALSSPEEAVSTFVTRDRTFEPDLQAHAEYQPRAQRYRTLLPAVRTFVN